MFSHPKINKLLIISLWRCVFRWHRRIFILSLILRILPTFNRIDRIYLVARKVAREYVVTTHMFLRALNWIPKGDF